LLNFRQNNFERIIPDEYYSFVSNMGRPSCGLQFIAMAAEDAMK